MQASIPLTASRAINVPPGQGSFGLTDAKIIAPGDPSRSLILHRMQLTTLGRMPHIASSVVDRSAVELLTAWIEDLSDGTLLDKPGALNPRTATGSQ